MRLIDANKLIEYLVLNMRWIDEDDMTVDDTEEKRGIIASLVGGVPTIDAIPIGCLELEKRDCAFADQCDMGSSYGRERERACKNIIEWWKTPSYQRCLEVAITRGFVDKEWCE